MEGEGLEADHRNNTIKNARMQRSNSHSDIEELEADTNHHNNYHHAHVKHTQINHLEAYKSHIDIDGGAGG